jgi:phosphate transport system substrate-binding protein
MSSNKGRALILPRKKLFCLAVAGALSCLGAISSTALAAGSLTGEGSTLVAPLEAEWAQGFQSKNPGVTVTYNAVGSGTGIADISGQNGVGRLGDFGASDAPLNPTQAANCNGCLQIPWALSATGVGYNLAGVHGLHLTGTVIAQMYLGQINNWNNPAIKRLNPHANLPNLKITPVFRTDGSGDTYAFTNYLQKVNSAFRSKVGFGTAVSFPTGAGGKGNLGVTTALQGTPGAIAYIAVSYLIAHGVPAVAIQNAAGRFEYPNLNNIENAAASVKHVPADNTVSIVNPPKRQKIAYPISTFTYAIVPSNAPQGSLLQGFIKYALGAGQSFGPRLDFAKIPKVVLNAAKATVGKIH